MTVSVLTASQYNRSRKKKQMSESKHVRCYLTTVYEGHPISSDNSRSHISQTVDKIKFSLLIRCFRDVAYWYVKYASYYCYIISLSQSDLML